MDRKRKRKRVSSETVLDIVMSFPLFLPPTIQKVMDVTWRSHLQSLRDPFHRHRRLHPIGFVRELTQQGVLTDFQASALRTGIPGPYRLGPFRVTGRLLAGRLGNVFRAEHVESNQPVSLKIFPAAHLANIVEMTQLL